MLMSVAFQRRCQLRSDRADDRQHCMMDGTAAVHPDTISIDTEDVADGFDLMRREKTDQRFTDTGRYPRQPEWLRPAHSTFFPRYGAILSSARYSSTTRKSKRHNSHT